MTMTRAEEVLLNETFKKIGQNIHNNRMQKKYSLKKLSRLTGLNIETIDCYEMGRTQIHIKELMKISLALRIKLENLLKQ